MSRVSVSGFVDLPQAYLCPDLSSFMESMSDVSDKLKQFITLKLKIHFQSLGENHKKHEVTEHETRWQNDKGGRKDKKYKINTEDMDHYEL